MRRSGKGDPRDKEGHLQAIHGLGREPLGSSAYNSDRLTFAFR